MIKILITVLALASCGSALAAEISCAKCHKEQYDRSVASAHGQAGLTCVDCHGGNPDAMDKEKAHGTADFRCPKNKRGIAEFCAQCHGDVRRMNPYGLPTDQLDRYKTSKHGEMLFGHDDQNVATCTDCHGVHDISQVKSPQSRVYPTNIPQTCGRCHANAELMKKYNLPADVVAQYKSSYHAHMLFDKGDLSAPTCVVCHGSHGATPPGTKEVGEVCGKCHVRQRELFQKSPHAELAASGDFRGCVQCHGNHAIQKASLDLLFSTSCSQCHDETDVKQPKARNSLVKLLKDSRGNYEHALARVQEATRRGLATDDALLLLQEMNTQVTQMEAMQHTLSIDQLQPASARAAEDLTTALQDVNAKERLERWKHVALIPIWAFLMIMSALFWVKRKQIMRRTHP